MRICHWELRPMQSWVYTLGVEMRSLPQWNHVSGLRALPTLRLILYQLQLYQRVLPFLPSRFLIAAGSMLPLPSWFIQPNGRRCLSELPGVLFGLRQYYRVVLCLPTILWLQRVRSVRPLRRRTIYQLHNHDLLGLRSQLPELL